MIVHRENAAGDTPSIDSVDAPAFRDLRTLPGASTSRGGAHRVPAPPHAVKGRAAVVAVAAGAVVAAGQTLTDIGSDSGSSTSSDSIALASGSSVAVSDAAAGVAQDASAAIDQAVPEGGTTTTGSLGDNAQVLAVPAAAQQAADVAQQVVKGAQFAAQRAQEEALAHRPMYVKPASGSLSSHYGTRWGTIHGGVDIANEMYTPIYAVADGEVIDAGPASGFGQWVRIKHEDGTVSVYGHIETIEVQVGQHVTAGDEIAQMGSRGFSTGSHLHFEIWENGDTRIDPEPWLAERGISLTDVAG